MHKLHELKEMLCEELEDYGSKDKLDVGGLDIVDKLAHAIKNIDKIIESYDGGYSGYHRSYARRRDRMGRYSSDGYSMEFREDLKSLMDDAPNEQIKRKIRELMQEV